MTKVCSFLTKNSGRQRDKFLDIRLAGRQQGGQDLPALGGDLIAVGAGDFLDEAVSAQPRQVNLWPK